LHFENIALHHERRFAGDFGQEAGLGAPDVPGRRNMPLSRR
jgi:hypothetical protein